MTGEVFCSGFCAATYRTGEALATHNCFPLLGNKGVLEGRDERGVGSAMIVLRIFLYLSCPVSARKAARSSERTYSRNAPCEVREETTDAKLLLNTLY